MSPWSLPRARHKRSNLHDGFEIGAVADAVAAGGVGFGEVDVEVAAVVAAAEDVSAAGAGGGVGVVEDRAFIEEVLDERDALVVAAVAVPDVQGAIEGLGVAFLFGAGAQQDVLAEVAVEHI